MKLLDENDKVKLSHIEENSSEQQNKRLDKYTVQISEHIDKHKKQKIEE